MRPVVMVLVLVIAAACGGDTTLVEGVKCKSDDDCTITGAQGTCQPDGFCAYPDATCVGGLRYAPGAGAMAQQCIGGDVIVGCGVKDQPCCTGDVCGDDLACTSGMCVCGEQDQPCCGGSVCSGNLACDDGGACSCGGFQDPCCGGTTCDNGLTCAAGSCTSGVEGVSIGNSIMCVLLGDKTVECWGRDNFIKGLAFPTQVVPTMNTLTPVKIANATDVVELRSGENHTCAKKSDGTLWCWGRNEAGQLGNGTNTSSATAIQVAGLSEVTMFDLGKMHTCAFGKVGATNATLYCWGRGGRRTGNQNGQTPIPNEGRLGTGNNNNTNVPAAVDLSQVITTGQTVVALTTGGYHSCVAMSDNRVWCWGVGEGGTLGNNTTISVLAPTQVDMSQISIPGGVTVAELTAGFGNRTRNNTCMRLSNNTVYCWGYNTAGQAGIGSTADTPRPATAVVTTALAGASLKSLASLFHGVCGLDTNGAVWCWGAEQAGQLGNNATAYTRNTYQSLPQQVVGLSGMTQLVAGHRTACAIDATKKLWCWGKNRDGQITRTMPQVPADAAVLTPVQVRP